MGSIVGGKLDLDGVVIEVVLLAVVPLLEWIGVLAPLLASPSSFFSSSGVAGASWGVSVSGGRCGSSSLIWALKANVWDDVTIVVGEDSWCDSCKIATAPKHSKSKAPHRFIGKPLEHMFIDLIPSPGVMKGVKGYNEGQFLFLSDPISKFADKKNLAEKSTKETINALVDWRNEMIKKGFDVFFYLRSDAGSNFTADEFREWCKKECITFTIAGPKHQEQNAFAETTYKTVSNMARGMLVHARLPFDFFHFAMDYALLILRVLPAKNLVGKNGEPITTYQLLHHMKPRVSRFKVFGCPVVFKRYQPMVDGKTTTEFKQLQQGSRGIFVGFPRNQAGWFIYVPEKIQHSHLVVSMDVVFDQGFLSAPIGTKKPFAQSLPERNFKQSPAFIEGQSEHTGDVTNLTSTQLSHWGEAAHSESQQLITHSTLQQLDNLDSSSIDDNFDDESRSVDSDDEPIAVKEFQIDLDAGSQQIDGFRRSKRLVKALSANQATSFSSLDTAMASFEECFSIFHILTAAAANEDIPLDPYIPEPKSLQAILALPPEIQAGWIKAIVKELRFVIENGTFKEGESPVEGDEVVPSMLIFKAKITSRGFLDKLKARCVA